MEGQAILALLAVLAMGMATGGVLVGAAIRAFSGGGAPLPHPALPTIDVATIERVTKQVQDLATVLKQVKG